MILSMCLRFGNSTDALLQSFRLVYKPHEDEDDTELMQLAADLEPLLAHSMVKFRISADSITWM
jgi:hypothetical protein